MSVFVAATESFEPPGTADFWQPLVGDGNFALTRAIFVMAFSVVLIMVVLHLGTRRMAMVPSKGQFMTESFYGVVRNSVAFDILGSKDFLRFLPLLFTQFTLILVNNIAGVFPVIQFPTFSRIGFAISLTLITFVVFHYVGIRHHGFAQYFKNLVPAGLPGWVVPLVFVIELLTVLVTRPLTLAMRLFANMFAGHILLLVFVLGGEYMLLHGSGIVPVLSVFGFGMGIVFTFFELLVQFLQAYVFVLLTAFYIAGALADEH